MIFSKYLPRYLGAKILESTKNFNKSGKVHIHLCLRTSFKAFDYLFEHSLLTPKKCLLLQTYKHLQWGKILFGG